MREVSIKVYDDREFHALGAKIEAVITVTVGFNGKWFELDLSEVNHTRLREDLSPWLTAGHAPDAPVAAPKPKGSGGAKRKSPEFEYGKALREFAVKHDITFRTSTGKYYYSKQLTEAFEKHLADTGNTQLSETYRAHLASQGQKGSMT
jgi:hypothetical protein